MSAARIQPPARAPRLSAAQRAALLYVCAMRFPAGYVPSWQSLWWLFERGYIARADGVKPADCPQWQHYRDSLYGLLVPTETGRALAVAILTAERLCSALLPCEPASAQEPAGDGR